MELTPTPEQRRELSAYEKICAEACKWCAAGTMPCIDALNHHQGKQVGHSYEYFPCSAPSRDSVISGLVREVERLREAINAVYSLASRMLSEPPETIPSNTGELVEICTIIEAALIAGKETE